LRKLLVTILLLISAGGSCAFARDTAGGLQQFRHTVWTMEDGAPANVQALAQSQDGYLWHGATTGAYRSTVWALSTFRNLKRRSHSQNL